LELYDQVVLDIFNGLTHQDCYSNSTLLIKDYDMYINIVRNHEMFHEK
jgi:hypothetical protein